MAKKLNRVPLSDEERIRKWHEAGVEARKKNKEKRDAEKEKRRLWLSEHPDEAEKEREKERRKRRKRRGRPKKRGPKKKRRYISKKPKSENAVSYYLKLNKNTVSIKKTGARPSACFLFK